MSLDRAVDRAKRTLIAHTLSADRYFSQWVVSASSRDQPDVFGIRVWIGDGSPMTCDSEEQAIKIRNWIAGGAEGLKDPLVIVINGEPYLLKVNPGAVRVTTNARDWTALIEAELDRERQAAERERRERREQEERRRRWWRR